MVKAPRRCPWSRSEAIYTRYHDEEWGVPTRDPGALFELLVLEGMQAGLSWITILKKRRHMRAAFHGFDVARIAQAGSREIERWLGDAGVIRHRGKLEGMVANARAYQELEPRGGFVDFLWSFVDDAPLLNRWRRSADVPSSTPRSNAMSKALRAHGFTFVGPTICYALMQSGGFVNDHLVGCFRHAECQRPETLRRCVD